MSGERPTYAALLGSHGLPEMQAGKFLDERLTIDLIEGVEHTIAHPEAVARGVRYIGHPGKAKEIMACYPGDSMGDPQERAAYENTWWLHVYDPLAIFDFHESADESFFGVGSKTTLAAFAGGRMLSSTDTCLVHADLSFFDVFPNSVAIENKIDNKDEAEVIADRMYDGLKKIAETDLSTVSFREQIKGVKFFQKFEIPSTTGIGSDDRLAPYLEELEDIPKGPKFSPVTLSDRVKDQLSIPREARVFYGSWGHINMSRDLPFYFPPTIAGVQRKEFFGSYNIEIAPPIQTEDGFVVFQRTPQGLLRLAS